MTIDYTQMCFVIMPFAIKPVGERQVDFDAIYDKVFAPAIAKVPLPEGGSLIPIRTDKDFFAGDISLEMFDYLEYSRIALADITGLNANVLYEIGVRHHACVAGTVIVRQKGVHIPFDINNIKAFLYECDNDAQIEDARSLITRVLAETLKQGRLDSPVQITRKAQYVEPPAVQQNLFLAEKAIRTQSLTSATERLARAAALVPYNPVVRLKLGLLLKEQGDWEEALIHFAGATKLMPTYADAWRERGIAENKLYYRNQCPAHLPTGEESLARAISLNPADFDAHACMGGLLKRAGKYEEALRYYRKSREMSLGNSYPLLNEIKLAALVTKKLEIGEELRRWLTLAEPSLRAQVTQPTGPFNAPWSCFDLSEVNLYLGNPEEFLRVLRQGLDTCRNPSQPETHGQSLRLLSGVQGIGNELYTALGEIEARKFELVNKQNAS